jgi:hypothetical protein
LEDVPAFLLYAFAYDKDKDKGMSYAFAFAFAFAAIAELVFAALAKGYIHTHIPGLGARVRVFLR